MNIGILLNIYWVIIAILVFLIPILLQSQLKQKIKSSTAILNLEILIGFVVLIIGLFLPFYFLFSNFTSYSKITKKINSDYYFTQQEFGWVGSTQGKNLYFYKRNKLGFDSKIGNISWQFGTGDFDIKFKKESILNKDRIVITENGKQVLDTILNFKNGFDFDYCPTR